MTELPVTPPLNTGFSAKQSTRPAEDSPQDPFLEGEEAGSLFNLALQASLSLEQVEPVAGWPATSLTPGEDLLPPQLSGGNLPVLSGRNGNGLPPIVQTSDQTGDFTDMELFNAGLTSGKPDGSGLSPLFREIQAGIPPSMNGIEGLTQAVEGGEGGSGGQFSLQSLQGVSGDFVPRSGTTVLSVGTSVGQPGWDRELGERIHWMLGRNIQNAEVKLTPPHLGPLEIRISMQNDQASVSFVAAQATTREALEAAIPRLREMLSDANLNLANVNVGGGDGQAQWGREQADGRGGRTTQREYAGIGEVTEASEVSMTHQGKGLVDHYV